MNSVPSPLANLDFKNTLSTHITQEQAFNSVVEVIKAIPHFENLKLDTELTLYVCRYIETVVKKHHKIDKKILLLRTLTDVFDLNPTEQIHISRQVDFLFNNGKIKTARLVKKVSRGVGAWLAKKLL